MLFPFLCNVVEKRVSFHTRHECFNASIAYSFVESNDLRHSSFIPIKNVLISYKTHQAIMGYRDITNQDVQALLHPTVLKYYFRKRGKILQTTYSNYLNLSTARVLMIPKAVKLFKKQLKKRGIQLFNKPTNLPLWLEAKLSLEKFCLKHMFNLDSFVISKQEWDQSNELIMFRLKQEAHKGRYFKIHSRKHEINVTLSNFLTADLYKVVQQVQENKLEFQNTLAQHYLYFTLSNIENVAFYLTNCYGFMDSFNIGCSFNNFTLGYVRLNHLILDIYSQQVNSRVFFDLLMRKMNYRLPYDAYVALNPPPLHKFFTLRINRKTKKIIEFDEQVIQNRSCYITNQKYLFCFPVY